MTQQLSTAVALHKDLRERIKSAYDLEDDEQTLIDTLDGISDLKEMIIAIAREIRHEEAMADGVSGIMEALKTRKIRRERRAERLRAAISWAMQDAGIQKIDSPDLTLSQRAGAPKLILKSDDEKDWPDECCTFKRSVSRIKIKDAIQSGMHLDLAYYGNPEPVLTIRTK